MSCSRENTLQLSCKLADLRTGVVIEPRENMRCASYGGYAVGGKCSCHIDGGPDIGSSVIDPGKDMAMQINHHALPGSLGAFGGLRPRMGATPRAIGYRCPNALWVPEAKMLEAAAAPRRSAMPRRLVPQAPAELRPSAGVWLLGECLFACLDAIEKGEAQS